MKSKKSKVQSKHEQEFLEVIQKAARDRYLLQEFFIDILTPTEYEEVLLRWQIVRRLAEGMPQRNIARELNVGIATVTRGSRELRNPKGGFALFLRKHPL